jgi:hypothetical protein
MAKLIEGFKDGRPDLGRRTFLVPETHAEVLALLVRTPPPMDPLPALQLGYWRMRAGQPQLHYAGDKGRGSRRGYTFKGDPIAVGGLVRLRYRLARLWQKRAWA